MYISIGYLILPSVVVSIKNLKLTDIDPPMLTICPVRQFDTEKLKSYGYEIQQMLISGFGTNEA